MSVHTGIQNSGPSIALWFWDKNKAFIKIESPVLYNLRDDEAETTDVAQAHPEVVESLLETAASARRKLGEFMQRGTEQRATGSVIPNAPVISHEKDWPAVDASMREAIAKERQMRHPKTESKTPKGRAKKAPKKGADKVSAKPGDQRPNVVVIFADYLGYGDLSCYWATKLKTPNIDRLAAQGRKFTDAHSASAVCTPSRYALLTGEYPHRKELSKPVFLKSGLVIDLKQQTVASVMKEAGYATACIGKWHLGLVKRRLTERRSQTRSAGAGFRLLLRRAGGEQPSALCVCGESSCGRLGAGRSVCLWQESEHP